jgi:hypothetical protein
VNRRAARRARLAAERLTGDVLALPASGTVWSVNRDTREQGRFRSPGSHASAFGSSVRAMRWTVDPGAPIGWGPAVYSEGVLPAAAPHRYTLSRTFERPLWEVESKRVLFVMLNPSTATDEQNDPTITRCCGFALAHGAHRLAIANLFSLRSTDPALLYSDESAEGDPENLVWILELAKGADLVIAAWGVHGALRGRAKRVEALLRAEGIALQRLGPTTKGGHPRHPLYLRSDVQLEPHVTLGTAR